jgi:maltooligosyltrehalose trehalohydrolase
MELVVVEPHAARLPMERDRWGWFRVSAENVPAGSLYFYSLNSEVERPDPASRLQTRGVHGPSCVVDQSSFKWADEEYEPVALEDYVLYEMHPGTFTPEGTFFSAADKLDDLRELGVNAVSVMPVAQFPGGRNWGYDGAYPYAVQDTYGGPDGLKAFVDACHLREMAVVLDVVYNHLGPEGNYLGQFGPYFTDRYKTPWGLALNFDGAWSDFARNHFIQNALMWFEDYRIDALRLDAVHAIFDDSAHPFLAELAERTEELSEKLGRRLYLISESDLNDTRVIRPRETGGFGHHAQWCDDFHHALHALLTGERQGYYADFGGVAHMAKAFGQGYVVDGVWSDFRKRRHGNDPADQPADRFVFFSQNHDQVGNRMQGERLSNLLPVEALRLVAAVTLTAPGLPMLFMGEEWAEKAPFLYFVSHGDDDLVRAVREGRKAEFEAFDWPGEPPDPQAEETFERSGLNWELREESPHKEINSLYKALIALRKDTPALAVPTRDGLTVRFDEEVGAMTAVRRHERGDALLLFNFSDNHVEFEIEERSWSLALDAQAGDFGGGSKLPEKIVEKEIISLPPFGAAVYLSKG